MKNIKRIVNLSLCFMLLLCSVTFTAMGTDNTELTAYEIPLQITVDDKESYRFAVNSSSTNLNNINTVSSLLENEAQAKREETNTEEILTEKGVYTSKSNSEQYMVKDKNGNLVATPLSDLIDLSASTVTETRENGNAVVEKIPTVKEIIDAYCVSANVSATNDLGIDLERLDQLSYWIDFKYVSTNYRVIAGEKVEKDGVLVKLDDGMMEAEVNGGELMKGGNSDDFMIIQIDATTKELHYLKMKDYDEDTGTYDVEFPCVGPYMITKIM